MSYITSMEGFDSVYDAQLMDGDLGIYAVALVDYPAIEHDFIALSRDIALKVDEDRRVLAGPLLIPGQLIERAGPGPKGEPVWHLRFTEETIAAMAERLSDELGRTSVNLMHADVPVDAKITAMWLTANPDKSQFYGFDLPVGTLFVEMKVKNKDQWKTLVRSGAVKGFSIEAKASLFEAKLQADSFEPTDEIAEEAAKGLEWRAEHGRGGTEVGVARARARDLSNKRNVSYDTVKRMYSYFARHEVDKEAEGWNQGEPGFPSAGRIAWQLWGGDAGRDWAKRIIERVEREEELTQQDMTDNNTQKLAAYQLVDGTEIEVTALEVGGQVTVGGQPAPDGEHTLADGTVIVTAGGTIESIVTPVPADETMAEAKLLDETAQAQVKAMIDESMAAVAETIAAMQAKIDELVAKLEDNGDDEEEAPAEQPLNMRSDVAPSKEGRISGFKAFYRSTRK